MIRKDNNKLLLILAFLAIYFVWGTTYYANLLALESIPPFIFSCLRYLTAGIVLSAWAFFSKMAWPDKKTIWVLSVSGITMLVGGSGLVVYAEQYIGSGYAAVVVATEPLWFIVLDRKRWKQYFSNMKIIAGLVIGFAGIALFSWFTPGSQAGDAAANHKLIGTLIVLLSAILWVLGTLYASGRVKKESSNIVNSCVQLLAAGLFSGIIAVYQQEWIGFSLLHVSGRAWGGLAFAILFGSLIAYMAFNWLVRVQPPAIVSTHTYVNPVVAVFVGWLLASEQIIFKQVIALVIVLAGVILTQTSKAAISGEEP